MRLNGWCVCLFLLASGASIPAAAQAPIPVKSALPAATLATVRAALPAFAAPDVAALLASPQTFWYDRRSMTQSYQAAVLESPPWGANANDKWINLVADAVEPTALNFYDKAALRFRFPFGATAGTDNTTNLSVYNFLWLPAKGGHLLPVAAGPAPTPIVGHGFTMNSWGWLYPVGAVVGEMLFVTTPAGELLPSELRTRTRAADGWAVDAFRPFPTARSLSAAIKVHRPNWAGNAALAALVAHLENPQTLTAHGLHASQLPGTFDQDGYLDVIPDFADPALVKELLMQTPFVSAAGAVWKADGAKLTYAAATDAAVSIVPKGYEAGVLEVSNEACMRCHSETGRHLADFSPAFGDIVLYGEMWGRDGIFTFHPFDEAQYDKFWNEGVDDNRRLNPKLSAQGLIAKYNRQVHRAPDYPAKEVVGSGEGLGM